MKQLLEKCKGLALIAAAAALTACGGGGEGATGATGAAAKAAVTRVEAYEQPATAVQEVQRVKSRVRSQPVVAAQVHLGPWSTQKSAAVGAVAWGARQVGAARDVSATGTPAALQQQLQWTALPDGAAVAAISIASEGAYGIRLGVRVQQLPGGAILRVYSQAKPAAVIELSGQEVLQMIDRNQKAGDSGDEARTWWTPDTGGDEATLEIELPAGTPTSSVLVSIPRVSHFFENLSLPTQQELAQVEKINESDTCNLDATCYSAYSQQRNSVARMVYVSGGLSYVCTGTLMNDQASSGIPYFLSANHCISTQSEASTLQTDWFYRSPSCNSRTLSSSTARRTGGATLLYASTSTDTSFMRLNDMPPAGAIFSAWDAGQQSAPVAVTGVHHPQGDLQKISFGTITGRVSCGNTGNVFYCSGTSGNYYEVAWSQGTTEGGSSGSGIFKGAYLIGTLRGGSAVCSDRTSSDYYGRLDVAYNAALSKWLATSNTTNPTDPTTPTTTRTPVYRFYNSTTGAHFYTASAAERDSVISKYPQFNYERIAFYTYGDASSGKDPVFRFYNLRTGTHFYSSSTSERDYVIQNFADYQYEAISWYAQKASGNSADPLFRFYNSKTGTHFYTISASERDYVIQTFKDFQYEGPAYYAWTSQ